MNTPRRLAALAMVMSLCLLVYTLGQRQLRQALAHSQETILNQLKKRFSALGRFPDLKRLNQDTYFYSHTKIGIPMFSSSSSGLS